MVSYFTFFYFVNHMTLFLCVFIFEREGEWAEEVQREKGQRIQSGLHTDNREPAAGLKLMNCEIMTWAKVEQSTEPPGRPHLTDFYR